ncbi:MAG: hypothetical protein K5762_04325 [Bacilli bacterium]|nr:hypothetical protein [Bacilli bacterium]
MSLIKRIELKEDILTLFFAGDVETESFEAIRNHQFKTLILDFEEVSYVSYMFK